MAKGGLSAQACRATSNYQTDSLDVDEMRASWQIREVRFVDYRYFYPSCPHWLIFVMILPILDKKRRFL